MNWYSNMKLKRKFNIMSVITAVLIIISILLSTVLLKNTIKKYNDVVAVNKGLIEKSVRIASVVTEVKFAQLTLDASESPLAKGDFNKAREILKYPYETARKELLEFEKVLEQIDDNINLNDGIDKKEELKAVQEMIADLDLYYEKYLEHIDLHEKGAFRDENGKLTPEHSRHLESVRALADHIFGNVEVDGIAFTLALSNFGDMLQNLENISDSANTKTLFVSLIGILVILLTEIQLIIISKNIRKPINTIVSATEKIQNGDIDIDIRSNNTDEMGMLSNSISNIVYIFQGILNDINGLAIELEKGNINYRINTEKYNGVFKDATQAINHSIENLAKDMLTVLDTVGGFGKGNFDVDIVEFPGEKAIATETLKEIQSSLKSVSSEINGLIEAANDGNLEYKVDSSKYYGDWKAAIDGLNKFVDNVVAPIKETQNALNQFSIGNFKHRITNEYKGEFNNIKQTVNYTAETIESYILEIAYTLQEMANKNFNLSIDREYLGNFEDIQKATNLIIQNLNVLTKDIISSAEQVSAGAKQISESSIALAEGATEQAESVEKLNNVVRLISKQTSNNTQGANKANELAVETKENAFKGSEQMDNMLIAMEEINTASNSISNIIKVIDDIAFQTNILALNAAVEAARAGEHGKGFAVVAEEVRNLAARSQQAAKETTQLIESSVQKVEEGSKIANDTAQSLLEIVKQIEDISELVEACAKSSNEQEISIKEITEAISQIATVTQNNTATSEESAAASEELASQAEVFYASVVDFKLKDI